ncbi:helix-turn-helix transcriptional regulator [uncultured Clostridium sp.]|uniref:helix-turn-helix domain-containing protein n=1 Tax=uncultured Clostridium sp. TaxID=59620 RepID=UPI0028E86EF4|nr:helix-turn-helix transcriptional regulator [uncultured Clostridium sp.]
MLGDNIRNIRKEKKLSINKLAKITGISLGYLSDLENNKAKNPSFDKLKIIADVLEVQPEMFLKNDLDIENDFLKEESESYNTCEFETPEDAMQFILKQPAIMGFGGFDTNKMTNKEIIEFANELLNQLKLLGYKYKK